MKRVLLACTALASISFANSAFATDAEVLAELKAMRAEIKNLKSEVNSLQKQLADTKAKSASTVKVVEEIKAAKANPANDVKISMVPAPKFETADGNYSFKLGGFAQVDGGVFNDDRRANPNGTNIRRARLNVSGTIAKDFKYKIENDFAGNASTLTDVYAEYVGLEPVSIMVGQFKEPFSIETLNSDLFVTFIERASPTIFSPDRKIGLAVSTYGKEEGFGSWTASAGAFGSGTSSTTSTDDEAHDYTGRLTWAPIDDKTALLHLGVGLSHRVPDNSSRTLSYASRAEHTMTTSSTFNAVNTGNITNIDSVNLYGAELAGVYGPLHFQSEYIINDISRRNGSADATVGGYYAEIGYFLTGESRAYKTKEGKFDRTPPLWSFNPSEGQWGAWQVAARYSNLDLNDGVIAGGRMKNYTLGLKWLPTAYTAISANYIKVDTDSKSVSPNDSPSIWLMRAQVDF